MDMVPFKNVQNVFEKKGESKNYSHQIHTRSSLKKQKFVPSVVQFNRTEFKLLLLRKEGKNEVYEV